MLPKASETTDKDMMSSKVESKSIEDSELRVSPTDSASNGSLKQEAVFDNLNLHHYELRMVEPAELKPANEAKESEFRSPTDANDGRRIKPTQGFNNGDILVNDEVIGDRPKDVDDSNNLESEPGFTIPKGLLEEFENVVRDCTVTLVSAAQKKIGFIRVRTTRSADSYMISPETYFSMLL